MQIILTCLITYYFLLPSLAIGQDVNEILQKMQGANALSRYQGMLTTVFINTPFTKVYRYKIVNCGNLLRKEELLTDGDNKEVNFDDGKYLWRFFPHKNLVIKERSRIIQEDNYRRIQDELELVKQNYAIQVTEEYNITNRKGYKISFKPKKADRPQQVYWIDDQTGIPFKIEKYGPNNTLVSVSSFSEINFHISTQASNPFLMVPPNTSLTEIQEKGNLTIEQAKDLMENQIILPQYIPTGFVLKDIVFRIHGPEKALQLFYTDGLSSLSVFETHGEGQESKLFSPANKIKIKEVEALINASGTLNILKIRSKPIGTTIVSEVFQPELIKMGESLAPTEINTPFGTIKKPAQK